MSAKRQFLTMPKEPGPQDARVPDPIRGLRRNLAIALGTAFALGLALVVVVLERQNPDLEELIELALSTPEVERAALERLVASGEGVWDTFPDPDVGRVLQRRVQEREFRGVVVNSNEYGMREASYASPKPEGLTRVVLLGDSFVFGYKVNAEDRLGVFLREFLVERGSSSEVEVLHLAASSWNILAETTYLRRQLEDLAPDLVVHVVVANDLDDSSGARGFGSLGSYSPQVPRRVGGMLSQLSPPKLWPKRVQTYLMYGLDHESRQRYAECAREIRRLSDAVRARGGEYLMLAAWESFNPMVAKHLAPALQPDQVAYIPLAFTEDLRYRIDAGDRHWNRPGHERIATLLYGLAQSRDLLPELDLPPWDAATTAVRELAERGVFEASQVDAYQAALLANARDNARTEIDFTDLDRESAKQVTAGIFEEGSVAPFASIFLKRGNADQLTLRGRRFPGHALEGGTATVFVEGIEVGTIALTAATPDALPFDASWPLPAEANGQEFLSVRIVSDDYRYTNPMSGASGSLVLERISLP